MLNKEEIEAAICTFFNSISAFKFIQSLPQTDSDYANPPRPKKPYGMVRLVTAQKIGGADEVQYSEIEGVTDDIVETIIGPRLLFISINAYGEKAYNALAEIKSRLFSSTAVQYFKDNNLGYNNVSEIRNISNTGDEGQTERFQFDLFLHAVNTIEIQAPCIRAVDLIGNADNKVENFEVITEVIE